ncbi:MAG: tRNA-dihydrouridine synthase family protein [Lachnospiraceae bacterium]|nr:tRNA-dihydrouridine synthase family protein [Lachnospiraceae bacterium]
MKFYFAPLEGITGYIFRNAYRHSFGSADKFFTPFITPSGKKCLNDKERNDILPEHNEGLYVVPQLLTRNAEDFLKACQELKDYGYREVNLNLGCPSGTVVSKGRGAGFLADAKALRMFLDEVFAYAPVSVSVKTRLGMESASEWSDLLQLYNQYPLKELIVHPRLRKDYYNGSPDLDAFAYAAERSVNPICYNGDIVSVQDYMHIRECFPALERVMIGRGFLRNPFLLEQLRRQEGKDSFVPAFPDRQTFQEVSGIPTFSGQAEKSGERAFAQPPDFERFRRFHEELLRGYQDYMSGDTPVLFKMKELWFYMQDLFPEDVKLLKKVRKAKSLGEYESIVRTAFHAS